MHISWICFYVMTPPLDKRLKRDVQGLEYRWHLVCTLGAAPNLGFPLTTPFLTNAARGKDLIYKVSIKCFSQYKNEWWILKWTMLSNINFNELSIHYIESSTCRGRQNAAQWKRSIPEGFAVALGQHSLLLLIKR